MKRAIIVGCDGQDGRILYDALEASGYDLVGIARKRVRSTSGRFRKNVDITMTPQVEGLFRRFKPHEVYYLAAFQHTSQDKAPKGCELFGKSMSVNVTGPSVFLKAMLKRSRKTRFFYASSSMIFGEPDSPVQDESTPYKPDSVYGVSKAAGMALCAYFRRHGIFASAGIFYNHESPYHAERFVAPKIIKGVARIKRGGKKRILLGGLDSRVDWGYAPDFVDAMRKILAFRRADDFIVATGKTHSVGDFVRTACGLAGLDWKKCVKVDPRILSRKKPVMRGNAGKLRNATGWKPTVTFRQMIKILLRAEGALG